MQSSGVSASPSTVRTVSVRQNLRWQGPIDLRRLVGLGYVPWRGTRFPASWTLVQREAGQTYRWTRFQAIEGEMVRAAAGRHDAARDRDLLRNGLREALFVAGANATPCRVRARTHPAYVSTGARSAFAELGLRAADVVSAVQE